jgi:DNA polymerase III epsilon subunit-like protein
MQPLQLRLPLLWRLSDTPYVVVDVETTGLDPDVDRVVEVAALRFESGKVIERFETLIDPQRDIPPAASEVHHLVKADLDGAPMLEEVEGALDDFIGLDPIFAHNASFDRGFLPCLQAKVWIDSARAARHAWPLAERHRNQYLRYWLRLDAPGIRKEAAHRAAGDAIVTGHIVHRQLKEFEIIHPDAGMSDFIRHVMEPVPICFLSFGKKHFGKDLEDVPTDYFEWMLRNVQDLDPDLGIAIEREIKRRSKAQRVA